MKLTKRIISAVRIPVVGVVVILAVLGCPSSEQTDVKKADQQTNLEKADQQTNLEKADIKLKAVIKLAANTAGLKFTGASGDLGTCKSKKKTRYCVNVPKGHKAEIIFRLVGSPKLGFKRMQLVAEPSDVELSDVELSDVELSDVELSDVELSDVELPDVIPSDVESSAKLNFGNQAGFTPAMQADFYVKVNGVDVHPDTNGIIKLGGSPGVGQNFTLIDKNKLKQIYSYQLEVCNENDDCHRTDPRVENEG